MRNHRPPPKKWTGKSVPGRFWGALDHHQCRCAGDAGLLRSRRRSRQFPDSRQGPADVATAGSPGFPELSVPVAAWLQVDNVPRLVVPGFGKRIQRRTDENTAELKSLMRS